MDSGRDLGIQDIADQLGVSREELPENALLANCPREDVCVLFKALYHRMQAVIGNDQDNLAHWLRTPNEAFKCRPIDRLSSIEGFREVLRYLESFS
ncbi:MAG: DUF2384 domain-containing protein [Marinobacter sp.]|nr:DUF2384 domain-containing protein [Marinobacter sp.]